MRSLQCAVDRDRCHLENGGGLAGRETKHVAEDEDSVIVKPITVMSVDELETLLPNIEAGKITWKEILEERFGRDRVKAFSVHQALYDLSQKKGVEIERNGYLLERFDEIFAEISRRYRGKNGAAGDPVNVA